MPVDVSGLGVRGVCARRDLKSRPLETSSWEAPVSLGMWAAPPSGRVLRGPLKHRRQDRWALASIKLLLCATSFQSPRDHCTCVLKECGLLLLPYWSFQVALVVKEPACQCGIRKRCGFDPWVGKIPWRREWQPTPVFLPGESHGQRSLMRRRFSIS